MKRTNPLLHFISHNKRLLLLLLLPLIGCVCGVSLYDTLQEPWAALLPVKAVEGSITAIFSQWLIACFQPVCLLLVLFLSGLSVCGTPLIAAVPIFWGLSLGLCEAHVLQHSAHGWAILAILVLPAAVAELVALLMATSESLRMSWLVAVQVVPRSARCGGLWTDFRLYVVRFLCLLLIVLGAGALDVLLRLIAGGLLS